MARLLSTLSMNIMVAVRACQLLGDAAAWNYCGNFSICVLMCAPLGIKVCQVRVNDLSDALPASSAFRNSVANVSSTVLSSSSVCVLLLYLFILDQVRADERISLFVSMLQL